MKKNIFLTGAPSSGKTTVIKKVIKKVIKQLTLPAKGFYTEEEREGDRRVGFLMHTLDGKTGYLAHQEIESEHRIRRYGVSMENLETIAVPSLEPEEGKVIILDEIGKMECFSRAFCEAAKNALDSPNPVIGTITYGGTGFIADVKARKDIEIIEVTEENRDVLPSLIIEKIEKENR